MFLILDTIFNVFMIIIYILILTFVIYMYVRRNNKIKLRNQNIRKECENWIKNLGLHSSEYKFEIFIFEYMDHYVNGKVILTIPRHLNKKEIEKLSYLLPLGIELKIRVEGIE